jgi:hypothetical protein
MTTSKIHVVAPSQSIPTQLRAKEIKAITPNPSPPSSDDYSFSFKLQRPLTIPTTNPHPTSSLSTNPQLISSSNPQLISSSNPQPIQSSSSNPQLQSSTQQILIQNPRQSSTTQILTQNPRQSSTTQILTQNPQLRQHKY